MKKWCFPKLFYQIDWDRGWIFLDKELQAITKESETGRRHIDSLVKIFLGDGTERWILLLLEIQHRKETIFSERMFIYTTRCYDKFRRPIIACALLADENFHWRPNHYELNTSGSSLRLEFLTCKLLDFEHKRNELERSKNPFATILLCQLEEIKFKGKGVNERFNLKIRMIRRLLSKGFTRKSIYFIFQFIDYIIALPEAFELKCSDTIKMIKQENRMDYLTNYERHLTEEALRNQEAALRNGHQRGIEQGKYQTAKKMLEVGSDIEFISTITGLDKYIIKNLHIVDSNERAN